MILTIENLNVYYGAIHALKGISLEIEQGKIVTIIGANGAGKSTTLRAVSGLLPFKGEIRFNGNNVAQIPAHERVNLGIVQVPEGRGIFANLSVEENLKLGAFLRSDKTKIKEEEQRVLDLFPRLKERYSQNAGTLSGGEQQMVAMARALMARPKLLLLDEPSLGLAPQIIETIFETIVEINKTGTTILLVEQNALLALEIAHKGIVLETGVLKTQGDSQTLLSSDEIQKAYLGH